MKSALENLNLDLIKTFQKSDIPAVISSFVFFKKNYNWGSWTCVIIASSKKMKPQL